MRDRIFGTGGIGELDFFTKNGMRNERFGPKQSAAQVAINVVGYDSEKVFQRARFVDMQQFFKDNSKLSKRVADVLNELATAAEELWSLLQEATVRRLQNRALVVSVAIMYFVARREEKISASQWKRFGPFLNRVVDELAEVNRATNIDLSSTWVQLQLAISQASVETGQLEDRHEILVSEFDKYIADQK